MFCCVNRWSAIIALIVAAPVLLVSGQEPAEESSQRTALSTLESEKKLDFYRQRLKQLRLTAVAKPDSVMQFQAEPLLTFENPISQVWDGLMFVWTDGGQPAAVMKCYYHARNKRWGRTFVSLSTDRVQLASGSDTLWMPSDPGLSFAPLPSAARPAADARRRLPQMRDIARRFEMVDHWGLTNPTNLNLRLLTTPLYRYEAPEQGVVDGAIFGYVASSPEALVLVEARETGLGLDWYYAAARFTRFKVTVRLDGRQIASFPRLEAWPPNGVYFHDPIEMPDYPF